MWCLQLIDQPLRVIATTSNMDLPPPLPSAVCDRPKCLSGSTCAIGLLDGQLSILCKHNKTCVVCGGGFVDLYLHGALWRHRLCTRSCTVGNCTKIAMVADAWGTLICDDHMRCQFPTIRKHIGVCGRITTRKQYNRNGAMLTPGGVFYMHDIACVDHTNAMMCTEYDKLQCTEILAPVRCLFIKIPSRDQSAPLCWNHAKALDKREAGYLANLCSVICELSLSAKVKKEVFTGLPFEIYKAIFMYCNARDLSIIYTCCKVLQITVRDYNTHMFTVNCTINEHISAIVHYDRAMSGQTVLKNSAGDFVRVMPRKIRARKFRTTV